MQLFIAEKPSLAQAIASAIGNGKRGDGCISFSEKNIIVSWAFGHILENFNPDDYDEKLKKWSWETLPIVPHEWKLKVKSDATKQFSILKNLISKADEIVHAGDPDREGQLLIDEILEFVGNKKPVKRILLNALDEKSVKQALQNLRDNREFLQLHNSALGRNCADWLIGMNLSRAFSLTSWSKDGEKISVGRVMTPTMCLVIRRENEIKNFTPVNYFSLTGKFSANEKSFTGDWLISDDFPNLDSQGRILTKEPVQKIANDLNNFQSDVAKILEIKLLDKKVAGENFFSKKNF